MWTNCRIVKGEVMVELRQRRLIGQWCSFYRRRTWLPNGMHWITDYGLEVGGLTVWLHFPTLIDPDDCCRRNACKLERQARANAWEREQGN